MENNSSTIKKEITKMKTLITAVIISLIGVATPLSAQSYTNKIGSSYYHSVGSYTNKIGSSYYNSDGSYTNKIGSSYYNSNNQRTSTYLLDW